MSSPTSRSLDELRGRGWTAQVVERWNQYARVRVDLFGCIDLVAAAPPTALCACRPTCPGARCRNAGVWGIQACAGASHAARRTKSLAEPRLRAWLEAGGRFAIWSWAQRRTDAVLRDGRRSRRKVWTLREEELTLADILAEAAA
jgi:hypothetical protein